LKSYGYTDKKLGVSSLRSAFVSYYFNKMSNAHKKVMYMRMRTSAQMVLQSYLKNYSDPKELVKVKLEPGADLIRRANTNITVQDRPIPRRVSQIRAEAQAPPAPVPVVPKEPRLPTNERKRIAFQKWIEKPENKLKHSEKVNIRSKDPKTYAKRIVRELNSDMIQFNSIQKSTIFKYDIKKVGDKYVSGILD